MAAVKTTLMRTLLGLIPCIDGEINIAGKTLVSGHQQNLQSSCLCSSSFTIYPFLFNVIDMVVMGRGAHLSFFSMPSSKDKAMAMENLRNALTFSSCSPNF